MFFQTEITGMNLSDIAVTIRSTDASGDPGTILATLTNPTSIPGQETENSLNVATANAAVFTAPAGTVLAAGTTYFVVADNDSSTFHVPLIFSTSGNGEEAGGAAG